MPEPRDETPAAAAAPGRAVPGRAARWRAGALIGVLVGLLGFAIAVQVHANSNNDNLDSLREADLVGILDDQNSRSDRLRLEISDLQGTLRKLTDTRDAAAAARQQAQQDRNTLGILLGTLPAKGPGVVVSVVDTDHKLRAEDVLDVVEELRGAGAEAISFSGVRVSTSTAFTDVTSQADGSVVGIAVDGTPLRAPYQVLAIGDPKTLDTALNIPGGIAATVRATGGELSVSERVAVAITAVRDLPKLDHTKPR